MFVTAARKRVHWLDEISQSNEQKSQNKTPNFFNKVLFFYISGPRVEFFFNYPNQPTASSTTLLLFRHLWLLAFQKREPTWSNITIE